MIGAAGLASGARRGRAGRHATSTREAVAQAGASDPADRAQRDARPPQTRRARLRATSAPERVARYLRRHGLARATSASARTTWSTARSSRTIVGLAAPARAGTSSRSGPGIGILTGALLRGRRRRDGGRGRRAPGRAPARRASPAIAGACASSRTTSWTRRWTTWSRAPWDLVANLPYHITSPVLHHVLGDEPRPERFVLMLQREVAERIAAAARRHELPLGLRPVPRRCARRAHRAGRRRSSRRRRSNRRSWSARRGRGVSPPEREDELWRLVQAGFRERRKMLHNVLPRQLPHVGRERFEAALAAVGIAPDRRPQTRQRRRVAGLAARARAAATMSAAMQERCPSPAAYARPRSTWAWRSPAVAPDGYHELRSVFLRIGLSDRVQAAKHSRRLSTASRSTVTPTARWTATSCCAPRPSCASRLARLPPLAFRA